MSSTLKFRPAIFTIAIIACYLLISVFLLLIVLMLWGMKISDSVFILLLIGWCSFCWSASYWQHILTLSEMQVRFPTIAEETALMKLIGQVQSACHVRKGKCIKRIDLRIEEDFHFNAFVTGRSVLVLSRGMIESFGEAELLGVIAHEIGHLYYSDGVAAAAFSTARALHQMYPQLRFQLKKFYWISRSRRSLVVLILLVCWLLLKPFSFIVFTINLIYLSGVPYFDQLFAWLWITNARFIEYERDYFAYELGFGEGLCAALLKLSKNQQPVSWSAVIKKHRHPVTQHRIRRLESLKGLPATAV